jgi:hypothetical protein
MIGSTLPNREERHREVNYALQPLDLAVVHESPCPETMSSIRSASSSTKIFVFRRLIRFRSRKSCSLPGVAMINDAPPWTACICAFSGTPPTISAAFRKRLLRSCSYCSSTCIASSRVGRSTSALGWCETSPLSSSITGTRNARVLPVPVCAVPIMSLP